MPRNGTGVYTLPAGNPVVTGTTISSTVQNNTMSDIAAALTNSVSADGQTPLTGPMALFTGSTAGTATTGTNTTVIANTAFVQQEISARNQARNILINGDMSYDQERAGASVTPTTTTYVLDQWQASINVASKLSFQQVADAPSNFKFSEKVTVVVANVSNSTDQFRFRQPLEGQNIMELGFGTTLTKPVSLQFWVKCSLTGLFSGSIKNGASNRSYVFDYSIAAANTWTQITVQIPGDTAGTWANDSTVGMFVDFDLGSGSNFQNASGSWAAGNFDKSPSAVHLAQNAAATWQITGLKLESNTLPTQWTPHWGRFGGEIQAVQRYFWTSGANASGQNISNPIAPVFNLVRPSMRAVPTVIINPLLNNSNYVSANPTGNQWTMIQQGVAYSAKTGTASLAISIIDELMQILIQGATFTIAPNALLTSGYPILTASARL